MKGVSPARWAAFGIWALAAASLAYWALRWLAPATPVPPHAAVVGSEGALRGDPLRVLGRPPAAPAIAAPIAPPAASRFQLIGVVNPRPPQAAAEGLALIAVDGRPPRAFRVGQAVDGDWVLQRVRAKGADLGARQGSSPSVALDLAPLPPPATGVLPSAGAPGPGAYPGATGFAPSPNVSGAPGGVIAPPPIAVPPTMPQPVGAPTALPNLAVPSPVLGESDSLPQGRPRPGGPGMATQ